MEVRDNDDIISITINIAQDRVQKSITFVEGFKTLIRKLFLIYFT